MREKWQKYFMMAKLYYIKIDSVQSFEIIICGSFLMSYIQYIWYQSLTVYSREYSVFNCKYIRLWSRHAVLTRAMSELEAQV